MEAINNESLTKFSGGQTGIWKVISMGAIAGQSLEQVNRLEILNFDSKVTQNESKW